MQFSYAIVALFAATALALPTVRDAPTEERDFLTPEQRSLISDVEGGIDDIGSAINSTGQEAFGADCDVTGCAAALGPTTVGCGAAAAQLFADPISDVACLAAGLNTAVNKPAACAKCSI